MQELTESQLRLKIREFLKSHKKDQVVDFIIELVRSIDPVISVEEINELIESNTQLIDGPLD